MDVSSVDDMRGTSCKLRTMNRIQRFARIERMIIMEQHNVSLSAFYSVSVSLSLTLVHAQHTTIFYKRNECMNILSVLIEIRLNQKGLFKLTFIINKYYSRKLRCVVTHLLAHSRVHIHLPLKCYKCMTGGRELEREQEKIKKGFLAVVSSSTRIIIIKTM